MPEWKHAPVPDVVRRTWPEVGEWTWTSPLRLRGRRRGRPGVDLVVVDEQHTHARGRSAPDDASWQQESAIYAELRVELGYELACQAACADATPVTSTYDPGLCRVCGLRIEQHRVSGPSSPVATAGRKVAQLEVPAERLPRSRVR